MLKHMLAAAVVLTLAACGPENTERSSAPKVDPAYQAPCVAGLDHALDLVGHFPLYGPYGSPLGKLQEPIDMYEFLKDFAEGPNDLAGLSSQFKHAYEDAPDSVQTAQAALTEMVDLCTAKGVKFPSKIPCSELKSSTSGTYQLTQEPDHDYEGNPYAAYSPTVTFTNTGSSAVELYVHGAGQVAGGSGPSAGFASEPEPDSQYWTSEGRVVVDPGETHTENLNRGLSTLDVYGDQTIGGTSLTAEVRESGRVVPCEFPLQEAE